MKNGKAKSKKPFAHVVPLGSTCLVARHLQNKGLRVCKYPFDWMYSSPYLVRHALTENFKSLLDFKQYQRSPSASGNQRNVGTAHKIYQRMQLSKKTVIFPHHQLWSSAATSAAARSSLRRAVARLRRALRGPSLFVCAVTLRQKAALEAARRPWRCEGRGKCPVPNPGAELCCQDEVLRLFQLLQEKCTGHFHFEMVYLVTPEAGAWSSRNRKTVLEKVGRPGKSLRISEVYCKGDNTGLVFQEDADMLAFHNLLTERGQRRFKLEGIEETESKGLGQAMADEKPIFTSAQWLKKHLRFVQSNPKRRGSSAHRRYEKYKKARTLQEFLDLGGCRGDFLNDQIHGYLSTVR